MRWYNNTKRFLLSGIVAAGLAGIVNGCAEIPEAQIPERIAVYEDEAKKPLRLFDFLVESQYGSEPVGAIITPVLPEGDDKIPFDPSITCTAHDGWQTCSFSVTDNKNHFYNGQEFMIRFNPAPIGFLVNEQATILEYNKAVSNQNLENQVGGLNAVVENLEETVEDLDERLDIIEEILDIPQPMACMHDTDCNDRPLFFKECVEGECTYTSIKCTNDTHCDDNDPLTFDECINGGQLNARCEYSPITCVNDLDCFVEGMPYCSGNNKVRNVGVCNNPGTMSSNCSDVQQTLEQCLYGCSNGQCLPAPQQSALDQLTANICAVLPRAQDDPSTPGLNEGGDVRFYAVAVDNNHHVMNFEQFAELTPDQDGFVHHTVSNQSLGNRYLVAVAGSNNQGDTAEVIRATQAQGQRIAYGDVTGMSSGIGGLNPANCLHHYIVNINQQIVEPRPLLPEVFTITVHIF